MTIPIAFSGFGNMNATNAMHALLDKEFDVSGCALVGEDMNMDVASVAPEGQEYSSRTFFLYKPLDRDAMVQRLNPNTIIVDFTQPDAVNNNADFYCRNNLPFVMGTTGGDREALEQRVRDSGTCAVIAPNMAKQIVAFQEVMRDFTQEYEGQMAGYDLQVIESHQQGKKDTSGTAKAVVGYFNQLGIDFDVSQIEKIRDPERQRRMGVPEEHLGGHGWHYYELKAKYGFHDEVSRSLINTLDDFLANNSCFVEYRFERDLDSVPLQSDLIFRKSFDDNVMFKFYYGSSLATMVFTHNVNGRSIYAEGTLDAIRFLDRKMKAGEKGKVYSMIDVLNDSKAA